MAKQSNDPLSDIDEQLKAQLARMTKSDTDVDAFPEWPFKDKPILNGIVRKVKETTQVRRGEEVDVRLAIVDVDDETYTLWESANLHQFFNELVPDMTIVVIYRETTELKGGKRMKVYDAYHD